MTSVLGYRLSGDRRMCNILDEPRVILACWGMRYDRTVIFDYQWSPISKSSACPSVLHLIRLSLPNTLKGWKRPVNCGDGGVSSNCPEGKPPPDKFKAFHERVVRSERCYCTFNLLANNLYKHPLAPSPIEFAIENLFPGAKV